jgi:hypothetical protein
MHFRERIFELRRTKSRKNAISKRRLKLRLLDNRLSNRYTQLPIVKERIIKRGVLFANMQSNNAGGGGRFQITNAELIKLFSESDKSSDALEQFGGLNQLAEVLNTDLKNGIRADDVESRKVA